MPEFLNAGRGPDPCPAHYQVWSAGLKLLGAAAINPDGRTFRRLVVLGALMALLLALACLVVIVWRQELPRLPELPIPVILV